MDELVGIIQLLFILSIADSNWTPEYLTRESRESLCIKWYIRSQRLISNKVLFRISYAGYDHMAEEVCQRQHCDWTEIV